MDDREFDLAALMLRREVIAIYQTRTTRWHAVQVAALGAFGVALVAYFSNAFIGALLLVAAVFCLVMLFFSFVALTAYDRAFKRATAQLRKDIENLKRREASR